MSGKKTKVSIDEIVKALGCTLLHKGSADSVGWVVASSLMSDVLTTEEEEILLVSNLTTAQVIRTADMVGANAVLIASGKAITSDTLALAKELNITFLKTDHLIFECCFELGKLFFKE